MVGPHPREEAAGWRLVGADEQRRSARPRGRGGFDHRGRGSAWGRRRGGLRDRTGLCRGGPRSLGLGRGLIGCSRLTQVASLLDLALAQASGGRGIQQSSQQAGHDKDNQGSLHLRKSRFTPEGRKPVCLGETIPDLDSDRKGRLRQSAHSPIQPIQAVRGRMGWGMIGIARDGVRALNRGP